MKSSLLERRKSPPIGGDKKRSGMESIRKLRAAKGANKTKGLVLTNL